MKKIISILIMIILSYFSLFNFLGLVDMYNYPEYYLNVSNLNFFIRVIILVVTCSCVIKIILNLYNSNSKRRCPYCKEMINKEAIKCKHCNSDLRGK